MIKVTWKPSGDLFRRMQRARIFEQAQFYSMANRKTGHWLHDMLAKSR
jgi:hypothetical protein